MNLLKNILAKNSKAIEYAQPVILPVKLISPANSTKENTPTQDTDKANRATMIRTERRNSVTRLLTRNAVKCLSFVLLVPYR